MSITYKIDRENNIIEETWVGSVSKNDLSEYWKKYLSDPEVLEIRRTIVDLRESEITFTGAQLDNLIRLFVIPVLKDRDWKSAIVVNAPLQFGISRQYQVFADRYSKDSIFKTIDEARNWLLSQ